MTRSSRNHNRKEHEEPNNSIEIQIFKRKLTIIKSRFAQFSNYVQSIKDQANVKIPIDLKLRIQGAIAIFKEFNDVQTKLEEIVEEDQLQDHLTKREHFENIYYSTMSMAESLTDSINTNTKETSSSNSSNSVKLPAISILPFDGECENWLEFRDTFIALVHNSTQLTEIQKFHYLKSALRGTAQLVIGAVEFSAHNYLTAWELLTTRYDNNRLLIQNHVKALFEIKPISKESSFLLKNLIDSILKNLRALKALGQHTEYWDILIIHLIVSKLDSQSEREWEQYKTLVVAKQGDSNTIPTLKDILDFLKGRADMLDSLQSDKARPQSPKYHKPFPSSKNKIHCHLSRDEPNKKSCIMCHDDHSLYSCPKFLNLDYSKKRQVITKHKLCENCLRRGHQVDHCKCGTCRKCGRKHNTLLHVDKPKSETPHSSNTDPNQTVANQPISSFTVTNSSPNKTILLPTAQIQVKDSRGNYINVRALLDNGSERSFICQSLYERLNLRSKKCEQRILGVGGLVTQTSQTCDIEIRSHVSAYTTIVNCAVLAQISSSLPRLEVNKANLQIPNNINLADPKFNIPQKIEILIGSDKFWELLRGGNIRLPGGPFLQNTVLGWIVSGPIFVSNNSHPATTIQCHFSQAVETQLRKFWELEEVQHPKNTWSEEEKHCEQHFLQNTVRNKDGRFSVKIPFKEPPNKLGNSYEMAKRRFLSLERKLDKAPETKRMYAEFMREYLRLGHMSPIDTYHDVHYFLPHHGVLREHSTTTKLRVVFDASAVTSTGKSLNDIQYTGPPIQGDLIGILLRFRRHKYTASADIEKMYRQCLIHKDQRSLQLILWREHREDPLKTYQLNTVTYGTASAPFLSVRCLKQCAEECDDENVKNVIKNQFYVDDLLFSHDSKDELIKTCRGVSQALIKGCFPLRKWRFNFDCQGKFDTTTEGKGFAMDENTHSKTLGLGWNSVTDDFYFDTKFKPTGERITKRLILSGVSQIFDPLGFVSPVTIVAKVLMQKLWLARVDWDEAIPSDLSKHWDGFTHSVRTLKDIRIPRHVMAHQPKHISLHVFTDASQTAYGACIYVRSVGEDRTITVRLLCSKGKVAPIKPISIPRLELCGACLGSKLYDKIKDQIQLRIDEVTFWTDSTVVLGWLRMAPNLLKPFVQNRAAQIQELTKGHSWRHVGSKENPADIVSRGLGGAELAKSSLWWNGPEFLEDENFDNTHFQVNTIDENLPELKANSILTHLITDFSFAVIEFSRFSQFNRLKRAFGYVLRFIYNIRRPPQARRRGNLSVEELNSSELKLANLAQCESFRMEQEALRKGDSLHPSSKLNSLNPFMDDQGLIRVGGRIQYSTAFDYNKKHPIVLSGKHHLSLLIARHIHKTLLHAPSQAVLYHMRETWWPMGGQNLIKKVVYNCITCKRFKANSVPPIMGNLPESRITPTFPFARCGVDYAGPVLTLNRRGRGAKLQKSYICLFICFVTRAIHLELVSDLSSNSYLLALKRFMSRRGKPAEIFSDNGRNFVGAMKEFKNLINNNETQEQVNTLSNQNGIKFHFIPPYSPHFGGLWEAGVKACKHHLLRVIGNAHLTFEELYTVLSQIEAILNSRPLSPLSSDSNDLQPLTPGHFLIGRAIIAPAFAPLTNVPDNRLSRYQHIEKIRQNFWSRWSKEFISQLQIRAKWKNSTSSLTPNMLVLVKEDNLPPLKWCLGRVISTIPGRDGVTRVATIRTSTGTITRSFSKICPLKIADNDGAVQIH